MNLRRKTVVTVISKIGDRKPKADACLVVIYGQAIGQKFVLKQGEILIGRSSQAAIQIDHESVSRRHAKVNFADAGITMSDLGSTNGTYVNDEPITERQLSNGDLIKVGRTILKYLSTDNIEVAYHEEIYRLTTIDGLTRCFNARYVREQLVREVSRATRYNRPLSLIMFDVDDFAKMNEEFGHLAGDAVLAQLGKRLGKRIRREDVFARTGGGEFAIVAQEIYKAGSIALSNRMVRMIVETAFGFDDVQIPVTVSLGVGTLGEVSLDEVEAITATGERPKGQTASESFVTGSGDTFAGGIGNHDSLSRMGETMDKFHMMAEGLFGIARERLAAAKDAGKGRIQS